MKINGFLLSIYHHFFVDCQLVIFPFDYFAKKSKDCK